MPNSQFPWDFNSDQPYILKRSDKKKLREGHSLDFFKLIITNLIYFPYLFCMFLFKNVGSILSNKEKKTFKKIEPTASEYFYGLCVNLDKGQEQFALVEELGVKSLQIRFFLSDMDNIQKYLAFAEGFGSDKEILITIIQDREHIENLALLAKDIERVFQTFQGVAHEFMIGNAINRIKWGFVSMEEYLKFYQTIQEVRDKKFPNTKLIGSSIIDFEYHFTIRTLFNRYPIYYDKVASLLYVDRRGSPYSTQMGIFDLKNKINFLSTVVYSSKKANNSIYITEVNWPLSGTAPFAPTSEKECIDEALYDQYLKEYFKIAYQSGKVEKVYWHQLIASGYGLVDSRGEKLRKRKAFESFKSLCSSAS